MKANSTSTLCKRMIEKKFNEKKIKGLKKISKHCFGEQCFVKQCFVKQCFVRWVNNKFTIFFSFFLIYNCNCNVIMSKPTHNWVKKS
jgi:hypothetical protein